MSLNIWMVSFPSLIVIVQLMLSNISITNAITISGSYCKNIHIYIQFRIPEHFSIEIIFTCIYYALHFPISPLKMHSSICPFRVLPDLFPDNQIQKLHTHTTQTLLFTNLYRMHLSGISIMSVGSDSRQN